MEKQRLLPAISKKKNRPYNPFFPFTLPGEQGIKKMGPG